MTAPLPPWRTVGEWRTGAASRLEAAGIDTARLEADLLLRHVLGLDHAGLILGRASRLPAPARRRLARLLHKRLTRFPLQYLLGEVDFCGLTLRVTPAALIPRPETEGLVERALRFLEPDSEGTVLDVGTGTGCIALALAAARPRIRVWATDISRSALRLAARNATAVGLGDRVRFARGDLVRPAVRGALRAGEVPRFRAVVSNPPYVARGDRRRLPPEVAAHEPAGALFAGRGGFAVLDRLVGEAAEVLEPGGLLALEIGEELGERVRDRLRADGSSWTGVRVERDLAGRVRYAIANLGSGSGPAVSRSKGSTRP